MTLKKLTASGNGITEIHTLTGLVALEELELSRNSIGDWEEVHYVLASCDSLQSLNITANPIANILKFRQKAILAGANLITLNEKDISPVEREFLVNMETAKKQRSKTGRSKPQPNPQQYTHDPNAPQIFALTMLGHPDVPKPIPHLPPYASQYRDLMLHQMAQAGVMPPHIQHRPSDPVMKKLPPAGPSQRPSKVTRGIAESAAEAVIPKFGFPMLPPHPMFRQGSGAAGEGMDHQVYQQQYSQNHCYSFFFYQSGVLVGVGVWGVREQDPYRTEEENHHYHHQQPQTYSEWNGERSSSAASVFGSTTVAGGGEHAKMLLFPQILVLGLLTLTARATEPPTSGQKVVAGSNSNIEDLNEVGHGQIDRKYDYKQSFKKPFFIVKDSNDKKIPFYEYRDNAIASTDFVRLTSSLPNEVGAIWGEVANQHKEWQMHFSFRASGRGYAGGDGIGLWYAKEKGVTGSAMGSKDKWNGLGLIFSTSSRSENRFTPFVYGVVNDGTISIDGRTPQNHEIVGSCMRDYRNTPHAVWVRVTYKNRQLRVDFDLYKDGYQFVECFRAKNIDLPTGYYFGVSAQNGQLVHDDHDVLGLEVFEVNPHPRKSKSKFQDEYKLSAAQQKAIDDAKKAVEEVTQDLKDAGVLKEEEQEAAFNPQMVQNLQENQFKIIEALNQLEQKVNNAPNVATENTHQQANDNVRNAVDPVDRKVDGIKLKINELELKMDALDKDIKELFNVIRTGNSMGQMKLSEVSKKLDESHSKIKSAHEAIQTGGGSGGSSSGGIAMYVLFFIVGGLAVYAISVIVRMRGDRAPKKYI
ncbi:UNVERIFIED_CONTAM: hypothetical protein HDU68_001223 [Siphonaria sp. JEL0065]|nr:hypothetical protein HDU68_001223 [Siphonaria sp. JEL0065]